ncbi:MAG TPA: helix-turn-helix domain-containing protein, partial [Longimicrobium sp.]
EFIFRTQYDLRLNLETLRRDVEDMRDRQREPLALPPGAAYGEVIPFGRPEPDPDPEEERGVVVFRLGKTMSDLEREAIVAALREARGNRRRAAEMLDIGERTLYRKLKEYHLEP